MVPSAPPSGAIRVLLADGDRLFTRRLLGMLSEDGRFDVVGCAHDEAETVELVSTLRPDLVLLGTDDPADAARVTRRLRGRVPSVRVLVLGASDRRDGIELALAGGAAGFVRRELVSADVAAVTFALASVLALATSASTEGVVEPPVRR